MLSLHKSQDMPAASVPGADVYFVYIDESYDHVSYCYSAIFVSLADWNSVFARVQNWRQRLQDNHFIPMTHELHATNFIRGAGEPRQYSDKSYRAHMFREVFEFIESIPEITVMNAFARDKVNHEKLFEYMMNRINRTLQARNSIGILVCDEGNESRIVSKVRAMKKNNKIPDDTSRYGYNSQSRNIPLDRIVEDPLFKKSKASYMIQLADFIAFGLLRHLAPAPTTHVKIKESFEKLDRCLIKVAFSACPLRKGIIRA